MTEKDLSAMTVMQLRKLAKEQQITLGSGVDKAGIIRKILESGSDIPADDSPAEESAVSEPRFQAAWHNSESPRFNARPAYQAPGTAPRPAWQNTTPAVSRRVSVRQRPLRPRLPQNLHPCARMLLRHLPDRCLSIVSAIPLPIRTGFLPTTPPHIFLPGHPRLSHPLLRRIRV